MIPKLRQAPIKKHVSTENILLYITFTVTTNRYEKDNT